MIVLGVDPGSLKTGWGVVRVVGREFTLVACGVARPKADLALGARLDMIYHALIDVTREHQPDSAAIESIFTHRNARSALVLGHARGVALLALERTQLPVFEYPPATVKKNLTGAGAASKEQVEFMVRRVLRVGTEREIGEDAADALAVAICHALTRRAR